MRATSYAVVALLSNLYGLLTNHHSFLFVVLSYWASLSVIMLSAGQDAFQSYCSRMLYWPFVLLKYVVPWNVLEVLSFLSPELTGVHFWCPFFTKL